MTDITLRLRCFGAFRIHGEQLELSVPQGADIAAIKAALAAQLPTESVLIADSVLADDRAVLTEETRFNADAELAILPPVCGG